MIIKKELKLKVYAGVSTTGNSGRYLQVDIPDEAEKVSDILEAVTIWLGNEFTQADLQKLIASEDGLHIRIGANLIED